MRMEHSTRVRHWLCALLTSYCFVGAAMAETVTLTPVASVSAQDNNLDAAYDTLLPSGTLFVSSFPTYNQRTIFEFRLPPELLQPQVIIERATLVVPVLDVSLTGGGSGMMHISGHEADETLTIEDFSAAVNVQSILPPSVDPDWRQRFDLTSFVSGFAQSAPGFDRMSLMAGVDVTHFYVQWDPNATLEIEYALEPLPTLSVGSPMQQSQHWTTDDIHLLASASDWQDGNLDDAIEWNVIEGDQRVPLGAGADLTVNLPDGVYRIEASVTDSDGHAVREYRDIDVATLGNSRPEVAIFRPADGGVTIQGMPTILSAWATDVEDGPLEHLTVWTNEQGDVLDEGPTLTTTLPLGTHSIFAAVTDSGGLRAVANATVHVVPAPSYCSVGTFTTGPGWIATVKVNDTSKASTSNGGYADFTATQFLVARGANTIVLTAGGGANTNKYWGVWIDLNRDGVFTANEALVSVGRTSALSSTRTFTIPTSATAAGPTRMRVGVTYLGPPQACGVIDAGEFEDYTVLIPPL